jgi:hypothetical protein
MVPDKPGKRAKRGAGITRLYFLVPHSWWCSRPGALSSLFPGQPLRRLFLQHLLPPPCLFARLTAHCPLTIFGAHDNFFI